ncbi:MAG TPA: DUF2637 domain-containing protein [Trebonia sp.]|jgi:hypothetical protein|nr:DUF2637 domain-containing protein [Trebonia sp.]
MNGDRLTRWTAVASVLAVAAVAAWISYRHAVAVVTAHGEPGAVGHWYPVVVDGLIVAASMVLLDAARHREEAPRLAWWLLAAGIGATLAANVLAGVPSGWLGAVVAAWPALAFVGCYELLMMLVRAAARRTPAETARTAEDMPDTTTAPEAPVSVPPAPDGDETVQAKASADDTEEEVPEGLSDEPVQPAEAAAEGADEPVSARPQLSGDELAALFAGQLDQVRALTQHSSDAPETGPGPRGETVPPVAPARASETASGAAPVPVLAPLSAEHAAELAYRATLAAGNPHSLNALQSKFGLTRTQAVKVRDLVHVQSNGHNHGGADSGTDQ